METTVPAQPDMKFAHTPGGAWPKLMVHRPRAERLGPFTPDEFRSLYPDFDERSLQWLLDGEVSGSGFAAPNHNDTVTRYTADDYIRDTAPELLAMLKTTTSQLFHLSVWLLSQGHNWKPSGAIADDASSLIHKLDSDWPETKRLDTTGGVA